MTTEKLARYPALQTDPPRPPREVLPTLGAPASSPARYGQPAKCPSMSGYLL
ncbi:MAG: hypothetical protein U1F76_25410 [Candidatus Competibacteraceae bacterium]